MVYTVGFNTSVRTVLVIIPPMTVTGQWCVDFAAFAHVAGAGHPPHDIGHILRESGHHRLIFALEADADRRATADELAHTTPAVTFAPGVSAANEWISSPT